MALITITDVQTRSGASYGPADAASISQFCLDVSDALSRMCYPILLTPVTLTLQAFDAPLTPALLLPRPIQAISAIYYSPTANGDPSQVDVVNDLLQPFVSYYSPIDDLLLNVNRSGKVLRRAGGGGPINWGQEYRRPIGNLASVLEPNVGSVFVSGTFGFAAVPPAAVAAAFSAVMQLYNRRRQGAPVQSESWNGASYSLSSAFTAEAAVKSPEVMGLLLSAGLLPAHVG